jgi:spore coat protein SA
MAPSNVEFRPYCSGKELADMFRESDIFCAPSIWEEPFGMVNIEAFASGLPVVSTHGGGSAEVFVEGGGILVDRGSTDQLVDALRKLIADPALRKQIAAEGQASFRKNFTWDMARARYRDIVTGLLT